MRNLVFYPSVTSLNISKFLLFEVFLDQKSSQNCIFFGCMMTIMKEQWSGFCQFPGSKNFFVFVFKFFISRNVFKKGYFCQFLVSKIYDKIGHCFNIFCNICISENLGMSPVNIICATKQPSQLSSWLPFSLSLRIVIEASSIFYS